MCLLLMVMETTGYITVRTKEKIKCQKNIYLLAKPQKSNEIRHSNIVRNCHFLKR